MLSDHCWRGRERRHGGQAIGLRDTNQFGGFIDRHSVRHQSGNLAAKLKERTFVIIGQRIKLGSVGRLRYCETSRGKGAAPSWAFGGRSIDCSEPTSKSQRRGALPDPLPLADTHDRVKHLLMSQFQLTRTFPSFRLNDQFPPCQLIDMTNTPPPPPRIYRVSCPHCSTSLNCTAKVLGKRVRCSSCGHEFVAPELILPGVETVADMASSIARGSRIERDSSTGPVETGLPKIDTSRRSANRKKQPGSAVDTKLRLIYKVAIFLSIATFFVVFTLASLGAIDAIGTKGQVSPKDLLLGSIATAIIAPIALATYLMPTLIAYLRDHRNVVPIAVINICSGWFFLPWVGCLAWSFSSHIEESRQTVRVIRVNERDDAIDL